MIPHRQFISIITISLLVVLLIGQCLTESLSARQATPAASWDPSWPLSSEFIDEFEGDIPANLPAYSLDVELDTATKTLHGNLQVAFTNHTGKPLAEVPIRLYPNAGYYGEGGISVSDLVVDGEPAASELSVSDTVLHVSLGRLLPLQQQTTIQMSFETTVPTDSPGSFGIFSHDAGRDTWVLADWYPIVAGWDVDTGWELDPPTNWGDPLFAETSTYDVRISVPPDMSVVSTGTTDSVTGSPNLDFYEISSGPVREFAMVLDDGFQVSESAADGTVVRLHVDRASSTVGAAGLLETAVSAVSAFAGRYGPYPYNELDIVQTELASALGVSWSGVIFMNAAGMAAALEQAGPLGNQFQVTLVHEIGHQWWGNMIGVNSNDHAFMNESLTNYLTVVAFEDLYGDDASLALLKRGIAGPYLAQLSESGDGVVNAPIEDATSITAYSRLIYGKGGLGFLAIRLEIGDELYFQALRMYAETHAFGLAGPADLLAAFEQTANRSLAGLWQFWFNAAETTISDVEMLIAAATSR